MVSVGQVEGEKVLYPVARFESSRLPYLLCSISRTGSIDFT